MSIICVKAIRMVQADVNSQIYAVILRVPPACINNLIGICRPINGAIGNSIIHAIVTIIKYKGAQAVRPVPSTASITNSSLWRRRTGRRGRGANLICNIARESKHAVIECIVGGGMIEDGLFRSRAGIWRIQEGCDRLRFWRVHFFSGRATRTQKDSAKEDWDKEVLDRAGHNCLVGQACCEAP